MHQMLLDVSQKMLHASTISCIQYDIREGPTKPQQPRGRRVRSRSARADGAAAAEEGGTSLLSLSQGLLGEGKKGGEIEI